MMSPEQGAHLLEMADVLAELSVEIDTLGAVLCSDPAFVAVHVEQLQAIDLIAQKQRSIATMLRAECPVSAVKALGLDELRDRFGRQASPGGL